MIIGSLNSSELLFYGGIALMAGSVIIGAVVLVILRVSGKRLRMRLEAEYGEKRH